MPNKQSPQQSRRSSLVVLESMLPPQSGNFLSVPDFESHVLEDVRRTSASLIRPKVRKRRGSRTRHNSNKLELPADVLHKPITPGEKLRKIIKCILMIVEVCSELKRYVNAKEKEEKLSLVEMQLKLQADMNKKLSFNPHLYKASHVINKGSSKLKQLLAIAPEARTKKHIKSIHALVRNKPAFSKHPIHIRMKLCQVMIYQSYESRRVIIKEGHPPTAFYIILSGTCLVNEKMIEDEGEEKVITINEIKEGEVFGEVALLNKTVRTASVVCKDDVELLVIYQQDFDRTIRGPVYKQREEVIDFCRHLHVLKDWPVDLLLKASFASFQYQYFRKGSIVVKDGTNCNFVVFIKSGECRLISILDSGDDWNRGLFANIRDITNRKSQLNTIAENEKIRYDVASVQAPRNSVRRSLVRTGGLEARKSLNLGRVIPGRQSTAQIITEIQIMRRANRISYDKMSETDPSPQARYLRDTVPRPSIVQDTPYAVPKTSSSPYIKKPNTTDQNSLRNYPYPLYTAIESTEKPTPKFAQIAYLKEGSCFGLEELMKRTNLKLTLLSEGSEIVFISRKLLLRHANGDTMRRINSVVGKYPTEDYIRAQLAQQGNWFKFRESVVKDVLERKEDKKGC